MLIVNVASKCGLTPQYEQLQKLHEKYADQGLAILGFPCNQFLGQEPGSADEIAEFCKKNYGVGFDMFAKVDVKGDKACDLYKLLTALETKPTGAGDISWNFEKFVLDKDGFVVGRFSPRTKPDAPEIVELIEAQLNASRKKRNQQPQHQRTPTDFRRPWTPVRGYIVLVVLAAGGSRRVATESAAIVAGS